MKEVLCFGLMRWSLGWSGLLLAALLSSAGCAQATTWDRISRYLSLLKEAGIEALVAQDCPAGLMGGFPSRQTSSVDVWEQSSGRSSSGLGGVGP